jgi:hypothetical protein
MAEGNIGDEHEEAQKSFVIEDYIQLMSCINKTLENVMPI